MTLDKIGRECGTDKSSLSHNYTPLYERYFGKWQHEPVTLLEVGIGGYEYPDRGGESLRMWERWFSKARIVGADLYAKSGVNTERAEKWQMGQTSFELMQAVNELKPDIIIDDASHVNLLTIETFENLWPHLASGGIYVIEDLHTAYWPVEYEGQNDAKAPHISVMGFLHSLTHQLNSEWLTPALENKSGIDYVHFYKSIAFIGKK